MFHDSFVQRGSSKSGTCLRTRALNNCAYYDALCVVRKVNRVSGTKSDNVIFNLIRWRKKKKSIVESTYAECRQI